MKELKTFDELQKEIQQIDVRKILYNQDLAFLSLEKLKEILGLTIKEDDANKIITFLVQLSAFSKDSQLNLAFSSPSSTGKSYIATEIAKLFPKSSIEELGYASPKSFFHLFGEWNKETKTRRIDFERKIVLFLDMPHMELLGHLRPLLSQDKKEVVIKIVEKKTNRTSKIVLVGWSAFIFCTASPNIQEQESTRFIILSPETSQSKLRMALEEKMKRQLNGDSYFEKIESNPARKALKERIETIKKISVEDIEIAGDVDNLVGQFVLGKDRLKPRHSRDIGKVCSLAKTIALLNLWQRKTEKDFVIRATREDFEMALKLWREIDESQELNLSPYTYDLYREILLPLCQETGRGVGREEIAKKHKEIYGRSISDYVLRKNIVPAWENAGLAYQDRDEFGDRRKQVIFLAK